MRKWWHPPTIESGNTPEQERESARFLVWILGFSLIIATTLFALAGCGSTLPTATVTGGNLNVHYCLIRQGTEKKTVRVAGPPVLVDNSFYLITTTEGKQQTYDKSITFVCGTTLADVEP